MFCCSIGTEIGDVPGERRESRDMEAYNLLYLPGIIKLDWGVCTATCFGPLHWPSSG